MSNVFPINPDSRFRISTAVGGETSYSVPFPFQDNADIAMVKIALDGTFVPLFEGADYSLTGAGSPAGGTATLSTPMVAGQRMLRIGRAILDRLESVVRNGRFASEAIDTDIDRWIIIAQELAREQARSVKVPLGSNIAELPPPSAGKYWRWSDDGLNVQFVDLVVQGALAISAFGKLLVADTTAALARSRLGLGALAVLDAVTNLTLSQMSPGRIIAVTAADFGAVLDGSGGDQVKIKTAALYAIANGLPFIVPHKGLGTGIDLFVGVDAGIATVQDAYDAMRSWTFPRNKGDATAPYAAPYLVNVVLPADEVVTSGKGIVVSLPKGGSGDLVLLKGQGKTGLTFSSFVGQTGSAGLVFVTLQFAALPAGIAAGDYVSTLLTAGAGEHFLLRGMWQISAVDVPNKRLTIKVNAAGAASIASLNVTSGTFFYIPSVLRFINMPFDGNDRGGLEVQENCALNIQDVGLSGDSSGTNAASTNGIVLRKGASLHSEQHLGVHGFQRNGVWGVEAAEALLSYAMISYNNTGINMISGSKAITDYAAITGNTSNQVVSGIGSTVSGAPMTVGGGTGNGLYALNNGQIITSLAGFGRVTTCSHGIVAETGGIVHANDIPVVGCGIGASARAGSSVFVSGVFTANTTDYRPAINTPSSGALISNNYSSDL